MKKLISALVALCIVACLPFAVSAEGYGDNNINVDDNLVSDYIQSDNLTVRYGCIICDSSATVGDIIVKLKNSEKISAFDKSGAALQNDAQAQSGTVFKYSEDGAVLETAVFVILGDVDGDNNITVGDIVAANSFAVNANGTTAQLAAADMNMDGKVTVYDVILLRARLLG